MSKDLKIKIIVIFFVILMALLIFLHKNNTHYTNNSIENQLNEIFASVDPKRTSKITKYFVYGTHLNISGEIEIPKISGISISSANIVYKDLHNNENTVHSIYHYKEGKLTFSSSEEINSGFSLEELSDSTYYIFLKVIFSNSEVKYYSLENTSKYPSVIYYSLPKNNSHKKIDIKFDIYNNLACMKLDVSHIDTLPSNVYDIAIDASHGGRDTGAVYKKNTEAEIVLKYAKEIKQKLESNGYKVFLTGDGTESANANMSKNMYDDNGRINTSQESHSKLLLSLNINDARSKKGGVEVYAPTNCDLKFAKLLANNIVKKAKTSYSSVKTFNEDKGVYVRNFTATDILGFKNSAILNKYEPYNITKDTTYNYIIREIGGIATNAFVDGRNKNYGKNKYYDSNIGIEGYSIELGYIRVQTDLDNILNNQSLYTQAIVDSIIEFYK